MLAPSLPQAVLNFGRNYVIAGAVICKTLLAYTARVACFKSARVIYLQYQARCMQANRLHMLESKPCSQGSKPLKMMRDSPMGRNEMQWG